jgi:hypothetical protein
MTTRRVLLTGLAAVPLAPVPLLSAEAAAVPSPRLLDLKRQHEAAHALRLELQRHLPEGEDGAWQEAHEHETEIARAIIAEPVTSPADFAIKVAVWEASIADEDDHDGDVSEYSGWMDRAMPRLLKDARALLNCPAATD